MAQVQHKRTFTDAVFLFLKGVAMGAANKVPGVSGGIVALVAGFYEEFIFTLQRLNGKAFTLLFTGRFKSFWEYTNASFLVFLFSGVIFSYFSVSLLLDHWISNYPQHLWGAFFGMIVASLYYIFKQIMDWDRNTAIVLCVGALFGLGIGFVKPMGENDHLLFVFICGMISISGMTLPGLSGSFLLLILGNYNLLLVDSVNALFEVLTQITRWNFHFLSDPSIVRLLKVLLFFSLGSITGLVVLSNFLSYLLKKYHQITIAAIVGFIFGSLRTVWPWKKTIYKQESLGEVGLNTTENLQIESYSYFLPDIISANTWQVFGFMVLGALIIVILETYAIRINK